MKFAIEKSILLENLNNVIRGISTKNVIPVLNGIKFELTDKGLTLLASDSELSVETFIESKLITNISQTGTLIINSKYILEIIRKMPSDIINFESDGNLKVKIFSDFNEYNLNCLDPNDYPNIKLISQKDPVIIKADLLKMVINQTSFAISNQELRPILTGINFKITGDIFECVATDSYRLSKKNVKLDDPVLNDINIVIAGRNIIVQTTILAGSYPNTTNLIPTDFEIFVKLNRNDFADAVDRAALLTQGKEKNIIKIKIENKKMIINSYASEIGKTEETLAVDTDENSNIDISFSARYMLEALKTIKDDDILILLNNDVKPIIIKPLSDESLVELILPIKTY